MSHKIPTSPRPSRRRFLAGSAGAMAAFGAGPAATILSGQTAAPPFDDEITLALVNGRIHTMDASDTLVNTVSIRNGRFVAVGGSPPKRAPNVRVIDLKGRIAVNREFDITKLRWVVHHVPEVNADLLNRLKALGCGVEMGAFRWVTSSDPKVVAGPPFRTIIEHGIQVGIHGDGVHIAPLNPWLHIYYATTGVNSFADQVNPGQHLTRAEALRLFTRNNSWFLRMEEKIGSVERGKLADIAVLDRDYFTVPDTDIKKIRSVLTIVDGKIVHDAKVL